MNKQWKNCVAYWSAYVRHTSFIHPLIVICAFDGYIFKTRHLVFNRWNTWGAVKATFYQLKNVSWRDFFRTSILIRVVSHLLAILAQNSSQFVWLVIMTFFKLVINTQVLTVWCSFSNWNFKPDSRWQYESSPHGRVSGIQSVHGLGTRRLFGADKRCSGTRLRHRIHKWAVCSWCLL